MTHEILVNESRQELRWLDSMEDFYSMLFNYAQQRHPECVLFLDAMKGQQWKTANHCIQSILNQLIATKVIDSPLKNFDIAVRTFQNHANLNNKDSTISCISCAIGIINSFHNGTYATIDVTQIIASSYLKKLLKRKAQVFIKGKISFPGFPTKHKLGTSVVEAIIPYAEDFVSLIGYHSYVTSRTRSLHSTKTESAPNPKPTNSNPHKVPLALGGKINQAFTEIQVGRNANLSFHRTLRVPENGQNHNLPADLGMLPIHRVEDYAETVPPHWLEDGGLFIPLYQKEALFIQFEGTRWSPTIAKVCVGRVNALTGESFNESLHGHKQDYVLVPHQRWLDGINIGHGIVRQFVAMPLGHGYTVEAQISDEETFGGFQLIFYPPKDGRFPERDPAIDYRIKIPEPTIISAPEEQKEKREPLPAPGSEKKDSDNSDVQKTTSDQTKLTPPPATPSKGKPTMDAPFSAPATPSTRNADMGIAAGGTIHQQIYPDLYGVSTWDSDCRKVITIRLVNSAVYKIITGFDPPPSPVTIESYQNAGFPWYSYFNEDLTSVHGSKVLGKVQSIGQIDRRRGVAATDSASRQMQTSEPKIIRTPDAAEMASELRLHAKKSLKSMDWKEGLRSISMVLCFDGKTTASDYFIRSKCNSQLGYFKEGYIDACLALEIDENCLEALGTRAECRLALGDYDGAEDDARILTFYPQTERIGFTVQAESLFLRKRYQDAVYAALKAVKIYPNDCKLKEILDKARVESVHNARKNAL